MKNGPQILPSGPTPERLQVPHGENARRVSHRIGLAEGRGTGGFTLARNYRTLFADLLPLCLRDVF